MRFVLVAALVLLVTCGGNGDGQTSEPSDDNTPVQSWYKGRYEGFYITAEYWTDDGPPSIICPDGNPCPPERTDTLTATALCLYGRFHPGLVPNGHITYTGECPGAGRQAGVIVTFLTVDAPEANKERSVLLDDGTVELESMWQQYFLITYPCVSRVEGTLVDGHLVASGKEVCTNSPPPGLIPLDSAKVWLDYTRVEVF